MHETGPRGPVGVGVMAFVITFAVLLGIVSIVELIRG